MRPRRTRIKFCGMTRIDDALAAAALGADAVGIVLTRRSRRAVSLDAANRMRRSLPPFTTAVALFMDDDVGFIAEAVSAVAPDCLQFHGSESGPDCVRYGRPYLKSVAMGGGGDWRTVVAAHPAAAGFVFDGHADGQAGGSGQVFAWSTLAGAVERPVLLAGGLTPANVGAAIRAVRPYAVDVASGIESAIGMKDAERMRQFIAAVQAADED
jgi:phosphoribosylanthranilate isomerase